MKETDMSKSGLPEDKVKHGEDKFVEVTGYRIHYFEVGNGKPVILVPAAMATYKYWSRLTPLLSDHYRLLALDFLGGGDSDKPSSGFGYTIHEQADIIAKMIEKLKLDKVNLIGSSYGGAIVMSLVARYPALVNKVVSIEGGVVNFKKPPPNPIGRLMKYPIIGELFLFIAGARLFDNMFLKMVGGKWYPYMTPEDKKEVSSYLRSFFKSTTRHAFHLILTESKTRKDFEEEAKSIKTPVLYVYGGWSGFKDILVKRNIQFFEAHIPNVQTVEFKGGIHDLAHQRPKEVADLILDFLAAERHK